MTVSYVPKANYRNSKQWNRDVVAVLVFAALAVVPLIHWILDDPYLTVFAARITAFALAALSLDLILGVGGLVSLGHAAFLGIGAYTVAIAARNGITDILLQSVISMLAAGVFGLLTGAIALRTRGVYFIMITLAFGQMAFFFFVSLSGYGGDDGISLTERSTLFGTAIFESATGYLYLSLCYLLGFYIVARALMNSRFGRVLAGSRENELRMEALGYNPFTFRLIAYVISGSIASVAGVLLANQALFVSPAFMSWHRSAELLVMVILGGIGTLSGAILGAAVTLMLEHYLSALTNHWPLVMGMVLISVALISKTGLSGIFTRFKGSR
jgi:branched-chain amino acid transport system permease protein